MPIIRPITDLRNKFTDISRIVKETGAPIFLTRKGCGDMVVMSVMTYERLRLENEIYLKLKDAESELEIEDESPQLMAPEPNPEPEFDLYKKVYDELRVMMRARMSTRPRPRYGKR